MTNSFSKEQPEQHPLFPSGEWEGFYTYSTADKHPMQCSLNFKDGQISGGGGDDVGSFSWKGSYNKAQLECVMTKYYPTHSVHYAGQVDENGIWGIWKLDWVSGGVHLWPKTDLKNQAVGQPEVKEEVTIKEITLPIPLLAI